MKLLPGFLYKILPSRFLESYFYFIYFIQLVSGRKAPVFLKEFSFLKKLFSGPDKQILFQSNIREENIHDIALNHLI